MRETLDSEIPKRSAIVNSVAPFSSELANLGNLGVGQLILPPTKQLAGRQSSGVRQESGSQP